MSIRKKQFVVYGFRFEKDVLTEEQIEDFYNNYDHYEAELGTVVFIDSGMVGSHYWLGYLLAYGGDYCDLGITLDSEVHDESIHKMNAFLKDDKFKDLKNMHRSYFHIITRWG